MLGNYIIDVHAGPNLPQKVESGFTKVFADMVGASYTPIAYLGSKIVNGVNHAILAKQVLTTATDVTSVVLIVLNEKPGDKGGETFSIVEIRSLVSNGGAFGGLNINPITDIPAEALDVFNKHFAGFVGANMKPFALLGTQVVHGGAYIFAVESTAVLAPNHMVKGNKTILLVKVYADFSETEFIEVIRGASNENSLKSDNETLGYAFTWLTNKVWP